ncbi:hypothetical protein D3C80_1872590 [compost metagenome]
MRSDGKLISTPRIVHSRRLENWHAARYPALTNSNNTPTACSAPLLSFQPGGIRTSPLLNTAPAITM